MNNIKQLIVIVLTLLLVCATDAVSANSYIKLEKDKILQLQSGDYLRNDYIEALNNNLSPSKAYKYDSPQLIVVTTKKSEMHIKVVFNFHEAGILIAVDKDGTVIPQASGGINIDNIVMEFTDSENIRFGVGKYKIMDYRFVGNAKDYVASKVLCGKYRDVDGNSYIFKKDGWALFPKKDKFRYEVGLDHVEIPYDYYRNKKDNKIYAFKIQNGVLRIFATEGEESEIIQQKPMIVIKKIRKL